MILSQPIVTLSGLGADLARHVHATLNANALNNGAPRRLCRRYVKNGLQAAVGALDATEKPALKDAQKFEQEKTSDSKFNFNFPDIRQHIRRMTSALAHFNQR